jgi:uncharacterized membrane protein YcaP (DUF421 family)
LCQDLIGQVLNAIQANLLNQKVSPSNILRREGADQETLETALREHGVAKLSDVEMAVLEIDGSISVVPIGATTKRVKWPVKYLWHQ